MNSLSPFSVVTGAFGFSGRYLTERLLAKGERVRTLTGHPRKESPLYSQIEVAPFSFNKPEALVESLRGAVTLYNTYWVRFSHGDNTHAQAVENTKRLIDAALEAGVRRMVHVSIANPSLDSPLPYYKGKAELEEAIKASGLSYAILRPTVLFGPGDVLINNIAYLLRRSPVFAIPGDGRYRVQPIFVEDFADILFEQGHATLNVVMDAVGPEAYTYENLVREIGNAIGEPARIVRMSPRWVLRAANVLGTLLGDVLLTEEEIDGLMADLLVSHEPARGRTKLSEWLREAGRDSGKKYSSELKRHFESASRVAVTSAQSNQGRSQNP